MFENRSFDHMLGYLRYNNSNIDGCLPDLENVTCSNPLDPDNPNSARYGTNFNASYIQPADPGHGIGDTSFELFGTNDPNDPRFNVYPPPMDGFIKDYSTRDTMHPNGTFIMASFPANKVPIITTLAQEFALFDRWFADVPGPTNPNRLFSWLATSGGMGYNNDEQETIGFRKLSLFELIDEQNKINNDSNNTLDWKIFFEDLPSPIFIDYVRKFPRRFHSMDDFYSDALNGKLPFFSWLDPRYNDLVGLPASDQHPDHDVRKGEETMKRIYESVRNSDKWNETLLLIFYDEHGGFFDHVPPPLTLNPDNLNATDVSPPFYFNRLGIRIPAILISPYVSKGSMALRPDPSSLNQYSHSSLIHTIREQFLPDFIDKPLTKRDEISATFEYLIDLDEPRTDCITKLPDVPTDDDDDNNNNNQWISGLQPVGDFQYDLLLISGKLCNVSKSDIDNNYIKNQDTAGKFAIDCMNKWLGDKVVSY